MLLAEEVTIQVEIGTQAAGGGAVSWGAAQSIVALATDFDVEESGDVVNTKALGNRRKKFRGQSGETTISIGHLVDITGLAYYSGGVMLLRPIRITMKELSTLSTPKVWVGLIQNWKWTGRDGDAQAENIVVKCDIDATSY